MLRITASRNKLSLTLWAVFLICTGLVVVLCVAVQGVRFGFLEYSDLYLSGWLDEAVIYPIWKVQNGHPLYEWPDRDYYSLALYNFLFYHLYAATLSVIGAKDGSILFYSRILTLIFALIGCIAQWRLMRYLVKDYASPLVSFYLAMMAFIVWFGASFGPWALYIRPDTSSVAIATLALLIYVRGSIKNSLPQILLASCLFFIVWSIKQTCVWTLLGTSLYALFCRRQWKQALTLILPCAFLIAICLLLGGDVYRYNILFAPSINTMSLGRAISFFFKPLFLPNLFIWVFSICAPFIFIASSNTLNTAWRSTYSRKPNLEFNVRSHYTLIILILVVSFVMGFLSLGREGSNLNHMLEAFVAATTLSSISLVKLLNLSSSTIRMRGLILAIVLMLSMAIFPAAQILFLNGIDPLLIPASQKYFVVQILAPPQEDYDKRKAFAQYLKEVPKPLFIRDGVFSLPWHATDDKYPAVIIDVIFDRAAKRKGLLQKEGLIDLITRKHFRSLLITDKDEVYKLAIDTGYKKITSSPISLPSWLPDVTMNRRLNLLTLE